MCIVHDLAYWTFTDYQGHVKYFQLLIPANVGNALLELVHVSVLRDATLLDKNVRQLQIHGFGLNWKDT
jgi:hypothetical protein